MLFRSPQLRLSPGLLGLRADDARRAYRIPRQQCRRREVPPAFGRPGPRRVYGSTARGSRQSIVTPGRPIVSHALTGSIDHGLILVGYPSAMIENQNFVPAEEVQLAGLITALSAGCPAQPGVTRRKAEAVRAAVRSGRRVLNIACRPSG